MNKYYEIHAYIPDGTHVGKLDPGRETDEPGVRCMFGWGEPSIIVDLNQRDQLGNQILVEDIQPGIFDLKLFASDVDESGKRVSVEDLGILDDISESSLRRNLRL